MSVERGKEREIDEVWRLPVVNLSGLEHKTRRNRQRRGRRGLVVISSLTGDRDQQQQQRVD